jgi:hypothetical protein
MGLRAKTRDGGLIFQKDEGLFNKKTTRSGTGCPRHPIADERLRSDLSASVRMDER